MKKKLGDLLKESGILSEEDIIRALEYKKDGQKLGDVLLERGLITEEQLIQVLEFQLGIPRIALQRYPIDREALTYVSKDFAKKNLLIPIQVKEGTITVAMNDPIDYYAIDDLELSTGLQVSPVMATKQEIINAIHQYYSGDRNRIMDEENDNEAPAIRYVNQILERGITLGASDIHIDPSNEEITVRYRVDGMLRTDRILPKDVQNSLTARIKILADLNITESRLPQDGRFRTTIHKTAVDVRISTLPTVYGEKIVLRLLDLSHVLKKLTEIDFSQDIHQSYVQLIEKPSGLILLTGPTGSGKTSTLYASIHYLNNEQVNIVTIEDPVEFQLPGVNQVQVNQSIGLTFAKGLRSILRQDPNIIMVGEIRDKETAEIAVRASLTGHLVFSTLHTNSAVGAIPRLLDMDVEPFLVVSSVSGIMAQRLVRRICPDCKKERPLTSVEQTLFTKYNLNVDTVSFGQGCERCKHTGYRGRMAIHELLVIDDKVREMLMNHASVSAIRDHLRNSSMAFLVEDGLQKIKDGWTTIEEVLRVTMEE
ncbi:GspE/PulE family protein [Radiobacillus kanasensis]|uniref:GspE/PulE family protein n=1 Tax=Radiobacillus kanasensis TaxID=2844358 RepID=UPI001E2F547F|nr:GspE/PulE family protein [Radiobacillus kanasensis]UFT97932.1 GspE/PulE family protein [Radiobacillus kanasensis]